jgi:hypothetical protein
MTTVTAKPGFSSLTGKLAEIRLTRLLIKHAGRRIPYNE